MGNGKVVVVDEFFTLEAEFRHKRGGEVQGSVASSRLVMLSRPLSHQYRETAVAAVAKDNQNRQTQLQKGSVRQSFGKPISFSCLNGHKGIRALRLSLKS